MLSLLSGAARTLDFDSLVGNPRNLVIAIAPDVRLAALPAICPNALQDAIGVVDQIELASELQRRGDGGFAKGLDIETASGHRSLILS